MPLVVVAYFPPIYHFRVKMFYLIYTGQIESQLSLRRRRRNHEVSVGI